MLLCMAMVSSLIATPGSACGHAAWACFHAGAARGCAARNTLYRSLVNRCARFSGYIFGNGLAGPCTCSTSLCLPESFQVIAPPALSPPEGTVSSPMLSHFGGSVPGLYRPVSPMNHEGVRLLRSSPSQLEILFGEVTFPAFLNHLPLALFVCVLLIYGTRSPLPDTSLSCTGRTCKYLSLLCSLWVHSLNGLFSETEFINFNVVQFIFFLTISVWGVLFKMCFCV